MSTVLNLPAEGITLEWLGRPLRTILLNPLVSAGLLWAGIKYPDQVARLLSPGSTTLTPSRRGQVAVALNLVKVFLGLGVLYRINRFLSRKTLNNWVTDATWMPSKEIVLVTGGCSGIGAVMVQQFTAAGFRVAVMDVTKPKTSLPTGATFFQADITSTDQIRAAAEQIRKQLGSPTVLVNNAGVGACKPMLDESEEQIRLTFDVNVVAHFMLVREFLPDMIKSNHGHIVTIASMASFMVHASNVDYAASKAAALALHEGIAQELKFRYGAPKVRTTVVHPTWVRTPMIEWLTAAKRPNEFVLEPETVATAVVKQVLRGEGAQLILPSRYSIATSIRGWPSWIQEGMRNSVADVLKPVN